MLGILSIMKRFKHKVVNSVRTTASVGDVVSNLETGEWAVVSKILPDPYDLTGSPQLMLYVRGVWVDDDGNATNTYTDYWYFNEVAVVFSNTPLSALLGVA